MAANINPIFSRTPDTRAGVAVSGAANLTTTAVTATDGSGNLVMIYQADATEGSYIDHIRFKAIGSPAATVLRVFLCEATGAFTSGTTNTTTNTSLLEEIPVSAWTASNTAASPTYIMPLKIPIKPGHKLLLGSGTSTGASGNSYAATPAAGIY